MKTFDEFVNEKQDLTIKGKKTFDMVKNHNDQIEKERLQQTKDKKSGVYQKRQEAEKKKVAKNAEIIVKRGIPKMDGFLGYEIEVRWPKEGERKFGDSINLKLIFDKGKIDLESKDEQTTTKLNDFGEKLETNVLMKLRSAGIGCFEDWTYK